MIYLSHLDISRLFMRVLRMAGLRPSYSQGFNPHPKMSIALPLSLGLHSVCELIEFETEKVNSVKDVPLSVLRVNDRLPENVFVKEWWEKPAKVPKSLASYVSAAKYEIMCEGIKEAPALLEKFFSLKSVTAKKYSKKTREETNNEIRAEMLDYEIIKDMRGRMLAEVTLSASPGRTLNPVIFFNAFCVSCGYTQETLSPVITRTAILDSKGKLLREVLR